MKAFCKSLSLFPVQELLYWKPLVQGDGHRSRGNVRLTEGAEGTRANKRAEKGWGLRFQGQTSLKKRKKKHYSTYLSGGVTWMNTQLVRVRVAEGVDELQGWMKQSRKGLEFVRVWVRMCFLGIHCSTVRITSSAGPDPKKSRNVELRTFLPLKEYI